MRDTPIKVITEVINDHNGELGLKLKLCNLSDKKKYKYKRSPQIIKYIHNNLYLK